MNHAKASKGIKFEVVDFISDPGHEVNEDAVGAAPRLLWAIDGASARMDYSTLKSTAASRMVDSLSHGLRKLAESDTQDVRIVLRDAIAYSTTDVSARKRSPLEDPPSCAVGLALLTGKQVGISVLGDISIVVQSRKGVTHYIDALAVEREREIFGRLKDLLSTKGTIEYARERVWVDVRKERAQVMSQHGYHTSVCSDPRSALQAKTYKIFVEPGDRLLLATDGFARIVELFAATTWESVMDELESTHGALKSILRQVRKLEHDDSRCLRFPRMSTSDDASAIYARVDSGG